MSNHRQSKKKAKAIAKAKRRKNKTTGGSNEIQIPEIVSQEYTPLKLSTKITKFYFTTKKIIAKYIAPLGTFFFFINQLHIFSGWIQLNWGLILSKMGAYLLSIYGH